MTAELMAYKRQSNQKKTQIKIRKMVAGHIEDVTHCADIVTRWQSVCADHERLCFVSMGVEHALIVEKLESATAECDIRLNLKVYWLFARRDYESYQRAADKQHWRPLMENGHGFIPQIRFKHVIDADLEEIGVSVLDIHAFFGSHYLRKMEDALKILVNGNNGFCGKWDIESVEMLQLINKMEVAKSESVRMQYFGRLMNSIRIKLEIDTSNKNEFALCHIKNGLITDLTDLIEVCLGYGSPIKLHVLERSDVVQFDDIMTRCESTPYPWYPAHCRVTAFSPCYQGQGKMGCVEYHCSITQYQTFKLQHFPFDRQSLPILIRPLNFKQFGPAFIGNPDTEFVSITTTNLAMWHMKNALIEFNETVHHKKQSEMKIIIKLSRNSTSYLMQNCFLIAFIAGLSLTAYTLDIDDRAQRIGICLTLILTLFFIKVPQTPTVSILDKYYYVSFVFMVMVTVQNALLDPILFQQLFGATDSDQWILQENNFWAITFLCIFIIYHIFFIISISISSGHEMKKLRMTSTEIDSELSYPLAAKAQSEFCSTHSTQCNDKGLKLQCMSSRLRWSFIASCFGEMSPCSVWTVTSIPSLSSRRLFVALPQIVNVIQI